MFIIQMTGLSGSGKSTLAIALKKKLHEKGILLEVIDGDVYRQTFNRDLGFSAADRKENIRRLGAIANSFKERSIPSVIAAINPFEDTRQELLDNYGAKTVWVNCTLDVLRQRDTKGLYRRAFLPEGHPDKLTNLTGVNDVYENPAKADLTIDTAQLNREECTELLFNYVVSLLHQRKAL